MGQPYIELLCVRFEPFVNVRCSTTEYSVPRKMWTFVNRGNTVTHRIQTPPRPTPPPHLTPSQTINLELYVSKQTDLYQLKSLNPETGIQLPVKERNLTIPNFLANYTNIPATNKPCCIGDYTCMQEL